MAGLREAQKEMTRRRLLATALELFEAKGYAATTVDDIAAAAGTTRVTFYAYFPSRSDLMRALIGELNEALERIVSPTHGSTARALVAVVREGSREKIAEWLHATASRWDSVRPYLNAAFEAAALDPELRGLVDAWLEEAISDIEEGLAQAGRFEPETRHFRGVLAMSQLDHVARNWTPGRWNVDREQLVRVLAESWANLLTDEADPRP
ncbi:helix-turn-helix domain containing protein [Amycolatopsis cynarae]|uniref:Helix-turn-helix domain containing protein n=1 Tax=Amycolatopsis cynarae TaxID=2995223 RepID=A0ABY7B8H2_9PSEU|nr:TetR/AcrR family transcriptional regulator [Amycolatopsis sp. HUAS 11-8]WAL68451.1 helix-turn-helix domain containing protein [Amycolatopsis sp. HUAS 11-8]